MKKIVRKWLGLHDEPPPTPHRSPNVREHPQSYFEVKDVTVRRGETLTVWLDRAAESFQRDAIQVELRVTRDGEPEVFSDGVRSTSFEEWVSL